MNDRVRRAVIELLWREGALDMEGVEVSSVGGGCINEAYVLSKKQDPGEKVFVKVNQGAALGMFEAEAEGLREIAGCGAIRVPEVIGLTEIDGFAFLCLSFIELTSRADAGAEAKMGRQLAAMHRCLSGDGRFGWHRDNVIGQTPQLNDWSDDWPEFFVQQRLAYQFELANKKGLHFLQQQDLLEKVPKFFKNHEVQASLLHGDLWGGNAAFDETGEPVLFDPAVYFGDRETDLAFTELFGGFGAGFYQAYAAAWPLHEGYEHRKDLYNLYHILNHYNLFGGGYADQARVMVDRIVAL